MTEQQLPEGWQMVKFGDIAKHISKRVEPSETDLEIYVGLEHLDPDSLKIKRHGVPSDVEGQKLLVKKGQIIFGKRRAYQRKVAVADWDCICSAHAMVLEAKPKNVIPEFLPFFMQSDVFMNRAVAISEGSLSPTIKWKVLERQEFSIPSLRLQIDYLKLLSAINQCKLRTQQLLDNLSLQLRIMQSKLQEEDFSCLKTVSELCEISRGKVLSKKYLEQNSGSYPVYSSQTSDDGCIGNIDTYMYEGPHITWTTDGAYAGTVFIRDGRFNCTNVCGALRIVSESVTLGYLYNYLRIISKRHVSYVGNPKLMSNVMAQIKIPIIEPALQNRYSKYFESLGSSINELEKKMEKLNLLTRFLIR